MMKELEKGVRIRIRLIGVIFIIGFALVAMRAFDLQVMQEEEWDKRAERQHQKVIPLTAQRGTIFDSNGEELAVSVDVDSVYAEPRKLEDRAAAAKKLAKALGLSSKKINAKLKGNNNFVWLKRQVSPSQSASVKALKLKGVGMIKEPRRFYPNSNIAAHLLGFTGLDPKGLEGLELKYDKMILGRGGYLVMERDAMGRGLGSGLPQVQGATRGHDLYLTLDKNLQYIAERELADGLRKTEAKAGTVVMMEPSTGKVLAMASYPEYNPNAFSRYKPYQWRNRAVCDSYEPGSTFKVFLMAAALNEAVVSTTQKIDCENGKFRVGGKDIHDHKRYQKLTPAEIIKYSSNIGAAKIGKLLERDTFHSYLRDFGFGQRTGIDLPGEVVGLLHAPNKWFEVDLAAISFGQGVSATPIQLTAAAAAIANGGYLMEPYIVDRVVDSQGQVTIQNQPHVVRKVIARDVAQTVTRMMEMTTEEGGTATNARVPGFRVAGKTGTAQKVDAVTGGYSADKRVASFIGFLPAEEPRLVMLVTIDEPKKLVYGGLTAAPVFSRIAAQAMQYFKVAPNEDMPSGETLPSLDQIFAEAMAPEKVKVKEVTTSEVFGGPQMPDFVGLSYRQVLEVMEERQLNVSFRGRGRVVEQSPVSGVAIPYGAPVWVRMAPPT
ncbi:MAG: transpeptidase family protein [Deltaproteobacteria bacterium]|nr:transpeptidase family protein [Deltaproteobacteria bacterium]